jgi:hypothetical protein
MIDYDHPAHTEEYRGFTITVYAWGKSGKFYGELDNGDVRQSGQRRGYTTRRRMPATPA